MTLWRKEGGNRELTKVKERFYFAKVRFNEKCCTAKNLILKKKEQCVICEQKHVKNYYSIHTLLNNKKIMYLFQKHMLVSAVKWV